MYPEKIATWMLVGRIVERSTLICLVVVIAISIMIVFWRSVQRLQFDVMHKDMGIRGNFIFAMPVFILLILVGFTYVILAFPISASFSRDAQASLSNGESNTVTVRGTAPVNSSSNEDARAQLAASIEAFQRFYRRRGQEELGPQRQQLGRASAVLDGHLADLVDSIAGEGSYKIYRDNQFKIRSSPISLSQLTESEQVIYKEVQNIFANPSILQDTPDVNK